MGRGRKSMRQLEHLADASGSQCHSHAPGSQENDGVDESDDPFVSSLPSDTELLGK
jgi:hypothetical protein